MWKHSALLRDQNSKIQQNCRMWSRSRGHSKFSKYPKMKGQAKYLSATDMFCTDWAILILKANAVSNMFAPEGRRVKRHEQRLGLIPPNKNCSCLVPYVAELLQNPPRSRSMLSRILCKTCMRAKYALSISRQSTTSIMLSILPPVSK